MGSPKRSGSKTPPNKSASSSPRGQTGRKVRKAKRGGAKQSKKGKQGKKRRARSGTVALRDIRQLQKSTQLCIPKAAFQRRVRHHLTAVSDGAGGAVKVPSRAIHVLQEACEAYAVQTFEHGVLLQLHRKRKTLSEADLKIVRRVRGEIP
eukprot:TRINITY_DN11591_c0_g1_i1.p2 TRINITY_DN11591_c0_g1~~TRINITY_DN11591_c0_g1_i1.p2  ORF type:complete len:171 (+),score=49.88 TRINITY_DN11591_c0_g1_i1:66-515(+)